MKKFDPNKIDFTEYDPEFIRRIKYEDGTLYAHHEFLDKETVEETAFFRDALTNSKWQLSLHDMADVRCAMKFPTYTQFSLFTNKYPEIWEMMNTPGARDVDVKTRNEGYFKAALLHPEWVLFTRQ